MDTLGKPSPSACLFGSNRQGLRWAPGGVEWSAVRLFSRLVIAQKMLVIVLVPTLAALLLATALLFVFDTGNMIHMAGKFTDAFTVVLTGEPSDDASANARLVETASALPYIEKNWLLGNGDISRQWHGGYEGVLGAFFYPSDVGIIGTIYLYGLLGLLLFAIQFVFAIRFSNRIGMRGVMPSLTNTATLGMALTMGTCLSNTLAM